MLKEYRHWNAAMTINDLSGETANVCVLIAMVLEQSSGLLEILEAPRPPDVSLEDAATKLTHIFRRLNAAAALNLLERIQIELKVHGTIADRDRKILAQRLRMVTREIVEFHGEFQSADIDPVV